MSSLRYLLVFGIAAVAMGISSSQASAQMGAWYPYVIARGQDRQVIENTPIQLRPNRPLHFYGNAVRRNYQRSGGGSSTTTNRRIFRRRR